MIIVYCSKPQQTDAVTPTPLAHRSHTCMRALALGHDRKWVLKIKRGAQGEIECFKARYVVRGFEQIHGKDCNETWAPVGHYTTLRCLLVICVQEGLETVHLDIKCAFQNGELTDLV